MNRPIYVKDLAAFLGVIMIFFAVYSVAEKLTLTSYYPSPYGAYKEVKVTESITIKASYNCTNFNKSPVGNARFCFDPADSKLKISENNLDYHPIHAFYAP
ncbi:hypothetical protein ACFL6Y_01680 [Elusimicrobiota bacterium]